MAAATIRAVSEAILADKGSPGDNSSLRKVARLFGRIYGAHSPRNLTPIDIRHVYAIATKASNTPHSRHNIASAIRKVIAALELSGAQPGLAHAIPEVASPRPRNIIISDEEREKLIATAKDAAAGTRRWTCDPDTDGPEAT